jgi:hypothetical protein
MRVPVYRLGRWFAGRPTFSLLFLGLMVAVGAAPAACGGETDTSYGPADELVNHPPPQPTTTATTTSTATTPSDAGPPPATDSGAPGDGGSTGPCSVSWTNDVFPMFESTGSGACGNTTSCHGNGLNTPQVLDGNAQGTYNVFKAYTLINALPYIAPNDTNPAHSTMECNLVTGACGGLPMPQAPTGTLSQMQKNTIDTWLKCGAPAN